MAAISKDEPELEPQGAGDTPTTDQMQEGTPSSVESTPEPTSAGGLTQDNPPPQKRKGGRKPVCVLTLPYLYRLPILFPSCLYSYRLFCFVVVV